MLLATDLSIAEVLDRITICEVKLDHIDDSAKRNNIISELDLLKHRLSTIELPQSALELVLALRASNEENFMQIEKVFSCEALSNFGPTYVQAARAAFRANAERARFKRQINLLLSSEIIEEKTY